MKTLESQLKEGFDIITAVTITAASTAKTGTSKSKTAFASFKLDDSQKEGSLNGTDEEFDKNYEVQQMGSLEEEEISLLYCWSSKFFYQPPSAPFVSLV